MSLPNVMPTPDVRPALFRTATLCAVQLRPDDVSTLQQFFEHNPEYFLAVNGQRPGADEALNEFNDGPPPDLPHGAIYAIGLIDADGVLTASATVLADLCAVGVWHISLLIVATAAHGNGTAHQVYRGLEQWMRDQGAVWLRLGVVVGNTRAERFWQRLGYAEVRQRGPLTMGLRANMLRVMVKPLTTAPLADYLNRVPRDQPALAVPR